MIQIDGLSIAYQGDPLFKDASFSIQQGERCGLVGRNGSGKSTIIRILTNKETPDAGDVSFRKNYTIGTLDQHIVFSKPTIIEEAALGLPEEEMDSLYKAEKILFGLGFVESDLEKDPRILSGGYHLRLHLAKVLISEPHCLLLDEPTNYLDILSIRWLQKFLRSWKGEFILISHDREFMDSVTTHTMGIHRQKVRKIQGSTTDFYNQIVQEEEIHEKTRINLDKKRAQAQAFVDRFGAKASKATQAQSKAKMIARIPALEKLKGLYHLDFMFKEAPFPGKKMLEANNISFSYDNSVELVKHLALTVEKGERIAIIGKNGRGKSTLLKLLAKELAPNSGSVEHSVNLNIGYFGQTNIDRLHTQHTVTEEIATGNRSLSTTEIKGICGLMMFSGAKSDKKISVLSGGERSRVLLGKIVATPCNMLLLDEPTHHLDMESIEALIDALEDYEGAIILVTHSELILKRLELNKIVVCKQGKQELHLGTYEEFLEKKGWDEEIEEGKGKKKNSDPREQKQIKADLINARSKAIKPLDNDIAYKENLITKLEIEQQEAEKKMIELAQTGSKDVRKLSEEIGIRKKKIESLYSNLDALSEKRDSLYKELSKEIID